MMNMKVLPEHYILKRWTREARCGVVQDIHGNNVIKTPKLMQHDATRIFPTSSFQSLLGQLTMEKSIHMLMMYLILYIEISIKKIKNSLDISANQSMEQETIAISKKYSHITGLKKKVVKKKTSRQQRTWFDKLHSAAQRKRSLNMPEDNSHMLHKIEHALLLLIIRVLLHGAGWIS
jgi:hypothetical protein